MSEISDPRLEWLCTIDLAKSRVKLSKKPIILLCGGKVYIKNNPDDPELPTPSLRHALIHSTFHIPYEMFCPEEIKNWHTDGVFKDLMNFELELSGICSLIVIILESEGSLVELGAFSQVRELKNKVIVIQSSIFADDDSFINLGILHFIKEASEGKIKNYPWKINEPLKISNDIINDVIEDINYEIRSLEKEQSFNVNIVTHVTTLIYELIKIFIALKESEIIDFLSLLDITIKADDLRRKLFILKNFKLIKCQRYSDASFYMNSDSEDTYHKIHFALNTKEKVSDALRVYASCLNFYKNDPKQRNRHRAITGAFKK